MAEAAIVPDGELTTTRTANQTGRSRAARNKSIRQEAMREQLRCAGLITHVINTAKKLADLDTELDALEIQRLKASADLRIKMIGKYLPDLKTVELEAGDGMPEGGLEITIRTVKPEEKPIEGEVIEESKDNG